MKSRTLFLLTGLGGTLIVSAAARGGFTGVEVFAKEVDPCRFDDPTLRLFVCNIYATFDGTGGDGDYIQAVAGIAGSPLSIRVDNGVFFQHDFGDDQAPNSAFFDLFPSLAFDTFVTIGKKSDDTGTSLSPGWPGFGPAELGGNQDLNGDGTPDGQNIAWFITPDNEQSFPDKNNRVILGQYTLDLNDPGNATATGIAGEFLLQAFSNGVVIQEYITFEHLIPGPSGPGLLALAALRRRRGRGRGVFNI